MLKKISVSDLRAQIKQVLNEVGFGQSEYVVEKFGEPTAAIISIEDFNLLQVAKQQQLPDNAPGNTFAYQIEAIQHTLRESGYQGRSKAEIDAQIKEEREGWDH